jgi:polyhydroxyalkanoate synthesis repressor PhaR
MQEPRIIKRYPNRRLYDTLTSSYITLDDVKDLVLKHIKFKIIDNKTNEDLTTYTLLQIISEYENQQAPIFTAQMLENIIRFYGNPLQKNISHFLDDFFSRLGSQQDFNQFAGKNPLDMMSEFTQRSMEIWQSAFEPFQPKKTSEKSDKKTKK